jgi:hypothetical protein
MVVRNTTRLDTLRLEHACSHDIFLGLQTERLEVKFAKIGVLWQSYRRYYGCHVMGRYLGCKNIVAITPVLVESRETDPGHPRTKD